MSENLEDLDGIQVGGGKAGVNVMLGAEGCPDGPGIVSGSGTVWRDAGSCRFFDSAQINICK